MRPALPTLAAVVALAAAAPALAQCPCDRCDPFRCPAPDVCRVREVNPSIRREPRYGTEMERYYRNGNGNGGSRLPPPGVREEVVPRREYERALAEEEDFRRREEQLRRDWEEYDLRYRRMPSCDCSRSSCSPPYSYRSCR